MGNQANQSRSFETELLTVYLTGLQAEIEAKLRYVKKFREQVEQIQSRDDLHRASRRRIAEALIVQVKQMLETNLVVRETLQEVLTVAEGVLRESNS